MKRFFSYPLPFLLFLVLGMPLLLFSSDSAYALGPIGIAEPLTGAYRFSLGFGYSYFRAEYKPDDEFIRTPVAVLEWLDTDVKSNQFYLQGTYALHSGVEVYARLGIADLQADDAWVGIDFEDNYKFFGTLGAKALVFSNWFMSVAPYVQASFFSSYKDVVTGQAQGILASFEVEVENPVDMNGGIIFHFKSATETYHFYAGPMIFWSQAKAKATITIAGTKFTDSTTVTENNFIGAFAGIHIWLGGPFQLQAEGQYRSKFALAGVSLSYSL